MELLKNERMVTMIIILHDELKKILIIVLESVFTIDLFFYYAL
jgi:hypothetical protein